MYKASFLIGIMLFLLACQDGGRETVDGERLTVNGEEEAAGTSLALTTQSSELPFHRQFIISITPDWDAVNGKLYLMEWKDGKWEMAREPIPMVVGKKGMAWGRGLDDYSRFEGPVKREGDKKSPAGVFHLGTAFGYAPSEEAGFVKADYTHVIGSTMCIEDGASNSYNQIVDENSTSADWNSTDHMLRKDDLYEWGMFVLHNQPEPTPAGGSCIFLHVWRENDSGTAGCTAMDKGNMQEVLAWVDPTKNPLMIQVPAYEYEKFRSAYNLPTL